jgi:hypothetical protein
MFLPETDLIFEQVVFPVNGKGLFFDWQYDAENKTLIGLNHTAIGDGQGEENIIVRVKAGKIKTQAVKRTVGLSIVQHHDGAVFPSNDQSNDNSIMTLQVKSDISHQPVQLAIHNTDCNSVEITCLQGKTGVDGKIEVNRSAEGETSRKVGSLATVFSEGNMMLNFHDTVGLEVGKTYTYELVWVRADGSTEIVGSASVLNDCVAGKNEWEMFPNPAVDKTFIRLGGELKNKKVDLIFTNVRGENIKTVEGVSNEANEISLAGLPSGIYFVGMKGYDTLQKKRMIKIDH